MISLQRMHVHQCLRKLVIKVSIFVSITASFNVLTGLLKTVRDYLRLFLLSMPNIIIICNIYIEYRLLNSISNHYSTFVSIFFMFLDITLLSDKRFIESLEKLSVISISLLQKFTAQVNITIVEIRNCSAHKSRISCEMQM